MSEFLRSCQYLERLPIPIRGQYPSLRLIGSRAAVDIGNAAANLIQMLACEVAAYQYLPVGDAALCFRARWAYNPSGAGELVAGNEAGPTPTLALIDGPAPLAYRGVPESSSPACDRRTLIKTRTFAVETANQTFAFEPIGTFHCTIPR